MEAFGSTLQQQSSVVSEWADNIEFDVDDPDFSGEPGAHCVLSALPTASGLARSSTFSFSIGTTHVAGSVPRFVKVPPSTMSVASVQAPHLAPLSNRASLSVSSSLSDLVGSPSMASSAAVAAAAFEVSSEAGLTIEDLRAQLGSCFTCGVMWVDQQVSLDCSECGGYSLERPCMLCDGQCGQLWKRDFTMSHACGKARWQGVCTKYAPAAQMIQLQSAPLSSCASFSSHHQLMQTAAAAAAAASTVGCHQNASQQFMQQELCARLEKLSATAHN